MRGESAGATGQAAFQHVRDNIDDLNGRTGIQDTDLIFLKGIMDSPVMKSLVKMQDRLEENDGSFKPVGTGNLQLMKEVQHHCRLKKSKDAQEIVQLLQDPHLRALLDAHDTIACKTYEPPEPAPTKADTPDPPSNGIPPDAIRMVGLRKNPNEPLGVTVQVDNGELVIARILGGGMIDRQGLLRVGDVIKEVNGVEVQTPEQLQEQIKKAQANITLKILPSFNDQQPLAQSPSTRKGGRRSPSTPRTLRKLVNTFNDNLHVTPSYVKALFSYDPKHDTLLPCPEIGLAFKQGDILQILNQNDPNWWQAKKINSEGNAGTAGLIPSQELEERRKAFVRPEFDYATKTTMCGTRVAKKKKKQMYQTKQNAEFDKAELMLYEEVAKMPPFQRKTLVLLGAEGVGRRTLKTKLLSKDPQRFGTTIPYTSRPARESEEDGKAYLFTTRAIMESDINQNKYLECGEYNGHLYGTKLDTIRSVIRSGKMCILDCNPQALKLLNTPEFMPYVVLVLAPGMERLKQQYEQKHGHGSRNLNFERSSSRQSRRARTLESLASLYEEEDLKKTMEENARLQRAYEKFIDLCIINDDPETTFDKLLKAVNQLSAEPQWVPISWVY